MNRRTRLFGAGLLVVFWAGATVPAVTGAARALADRGAADRLLGPAGEVVLALEAERRLSVTATPAGELAAQREQTDEAARRLRQPDRPGWPWTPDTPADRTAGELLSRLDGLTALRESVDSGRLDERRAVSAYAEVIGVLMTADGLGALSRSREILSEQDALLAAVSTGSGPTRADRARLSELAGARRALFTAAATGLPAGAARLHRQLSTAPEQARLHDMEDAFAAGTGGLPDPSAWSPAFNAVNTALWDLRTTAARQTADAATTRAVTATVWAGTIGGVGLVALLALLVRALRRRAAGTGTPPAPVAAPESTARSGPGGLLHELDRRNQGLIQRQLRLLDALTGRATDPADAADLSRAGDFATRLRRNVEKSVILTGGTPDRRRERLVTAGEIVAEASAGIAGRERVVATGVEPAHLAGTAATDLAHLLAELVENAVTFGPADAPVPVTGRHEPDGYLLTVADSGPGMTGDDLATGHETMAAAEPPAGDTWCGLWAAGRFAARQDVSVELRNGPDGGLVAAVRIPSSLVAGRPDHLGLRTGLRTVPE